MAKSVFMTSDEACVVVRLLEEAFERGETEVCGTLSDLAGEIRDIFGMVDQPTLVWKKNG